MVGGHVRINVKKAMILQQLKLVASAAYIFLASSSISLPVLDVVEIYGKLAGSSCYGRIAPSGSSCQITKMELLQKMGPIITTSGVSREGFRHKIQQELTFRWPLKPYGRLEKSLEKTSVMNKGAETSLYMNQLELYRLYDPRNPTGPLPTSLRPQLNAILQREGIQEGATFDTVFEILSTGNDKITVKSIDNLFQGKDAIDYYDFLQMIGEERISWD